MDADAENLYGAQCLVCRRPFSLETEINDGFEAINICRECKMIVLNSPNRDVSIRDIRRRRRLRRRRALRYGSSNSVDSDSFSQRFSHLINLASQSHETDSTPNRSRGWQSTISDNESDSVFGESESNLSFSNYGGESDTSIDQNSLMYFQLENESYVYTDTDIDPMHAGLDQWNSDDQDEEEDGGDWDDRESPNGIVERESQNQDGALVHRRMRGAFEMGTHYADLFVDFEDFELEIRPAGFTADPGDYVDPARFEELLEQFAENDASRRGAPPASASVLLNLPSVVISKSHEKDGSLICPVCKDPLPINTEAKQLPCLHLYHPSCILPWLSSRNTCPVCRYELPTDDIEYEMAKTELLSRNLAEESSYNRSNDVEVNETHDNSNDRIASRMAESRGEASGDQVGVRSNGRDRRGGGWLFLAAAPIVSLVGIVLVLWFKNPHGNNNRSRCDAREQAQAGRQLSGAQSSVARGDRKRRWWSFF
ncbi:E3 ubiquitin-protein ligase Praja-2-like [Ananas comosus]|uniref:RING-type E3 ubiquitin transferase n=1 Tax=Ananas comosus TaxID=4615 RepID=A0A6P5FVE7_ANACO|nr:E3 ubiquitin-protein ligase Praja-2-like [Ananas comosus]XP_020100298.1 E3 ubiquitin-protein ligase Praja-2-like [Ananas comosus]XP_020100299.1 E3 ubiquitin-protein ligase Praja-2-like [Ananas comosus]XP_020100300.1 E3 ubiquitin-protein ligase Praja-2-like [Ananas comosus]XP_020100301.1 E3 ubiquitin-protein ligase Praja-2-like [Ananas comosus]